MDFLYYVTVFFIGLSAIITIFNYKNISPALRPIAYLSIVSLATEIIAYLFAIKFKNNIWIYPLAIPIEFGCYSLLFIKILNKNIFNKVIKSIWIIYAAWIYLTLIIASEYLLGGRIDVIIMSVICTIYCICYFIYIFNNLDNRIELNVLIAVTGMLFYFSFTSIYWTIYLNFNLKFLKDLEPFLLISICLEYTCLLISTLIKNNKNID